MIFRKRAPNPPPVQGHERLDRLIRAHLSDADEDTLRLAGALAGLLACVAYADRKYDAAEQVHTREALQRVHGLGAAGVDAICDTLREHIVELANTSMQVHTRQLRDRSELELRREVLDVLVDLAAADGELSLVETDLLRRTASAMGLTQDDYLGSQARHRERLSVLRAKG
jgi:uncharacterized tellurite resistance protein B-like protein